MHAECTIITIWVAMDCSWSSLEDHLSRYRAESVVVRCIKLGQEKPSIFTSPEINVVGRRRRGNAWH